VSGQDVVQVEEVSKDVRPGMGMRARRILDRVSFRVREGEVFGFVGPNGAGKTTTLKVLMGLIRASSGRARILGYDVRESHFHSQVGFLPENSWFYEYLTGREFLDFYARISGVPRARRRERVSLLLDWVGLSHAGDARLRTYSKGMLQRIGIGQALVHDPRVVFLDEPMSGLDPIGRVEIRDLIRRLQADGKTVFMNTHILSDVEMLCHRVAIIVRGRIRYEGATQDFLSAGERTVDVVLTRVSPELAGRLQDELGDALRGHGDQIELRVPDKQVGDLLHTALAAGSQVVSVLPHRVSLESIFLSAVEAGDADASAEPEGEPR
jgi:ABC-2 type transport system ATP-binding protein